MRKQILDILNRNARLTVAEIAERLAIEENIVSEEISTMEKAGIIKGYKVIVNEEALNLSSVKAIIKVKAIPERDKGFDKIARRICNFSEVISMHLMSGEYDFRLEVQGETLQQVEHFVSSKLSTIEGVTGCSTHFMLKKYKEFGTIINREDEYERLKATP